MENSTPFNNSGLTRKDENWNVIDQTLWEIMNSDTSLRSLQQTNPDLAGKIQQTFNYYDPQSGVFGAWSQRLRGEGRVKMLEVLNKEQQLLIEQAAMFEQQVMNQQKSIAEYKVFLARHAMELMTLKQTADFNQQAFGKGMMPDHYSAANYEREISNIRITEEELKHMREKELEAWRIEQNLSAAQRYRMAEDDVTNRLREQLEQALMELDALEKRTDLSESAKMRLIDVKTRHIDNLDFRIKNREKMAQNDEA